MKQIRMFFVAIGCLALLFAGASTVSAQALADTWFKVDISVKGAIIDSGDSSAKKANVKRTAYMFIYVDTGVYGIELFSERNEGVYSSSGGGSIPPEFVTEEGLFTTLQTWVFYTSDPTAIALYLSGKFKVTLKKGELKSATFSTLGATVVPNTFNSDGDFLTGKAKVKVKMIDEDDLPPGLPLP